MSEYSRRDLDGAAFTTIDTAVDGGERSSITSLAADEEGIVAGMAAGLCQVSLPAHEVFRHDETAVLCVAKCAVRLASAHALTPGHHRRRHPRREDHLQPPRGLRGILHLGQADTCHPAQ